MDRRSTPMGGRMLAAGWSLLLVLPLLFSVAAPASGATPPPPAGAVVVSAGQPPRQCVAGDPATNAYGINNGVYWSKTANAWLSAPWCYPRWGYLEASASGVVAAGQRFTVTAIPTDGSNSAQYAPETNSISWRYPGKRVSGCGSADLSCTVVPTESPGQEWSWFEFQVSMPRTFFIDSPGEFCAGQHICAGTTTHAWAWVGVPPSSQQRHVRGFVRDVDGKGVAGVMVTAAGTGGGSDRTDAAGSYLIPVKKGTYTVSAGNRCVVGKPDCTPSKRVTVPPSSTVDFRAKSETCPLAAQATSARRGHGRKNARPRVDADCLSVRITQTSPHKTTASAGDRIKYVITPSSRNRTGTVLLTVTTPDPDHARLLTDTITGSYTVNGGNLEWRLPASNLGPVSFSVKVRSDAKLDVVRSDAKPDGDPWKDDTLGIVATAVQGQIAAPTVQKQLDLLPCGQNPAAMPSVPQPTAAGGWTFDVGVDPRYGLVLEDLRLVDLDGGGSRLIAPRVSVPYVQVQTTNTSVAQFNRQIRLRPDGTESFGRSRLLKLELGGTSADAATSEVFAVYGIDRLGPKSGSCLLVKVTYGFRKYGTDKSCHPNAKIGYGDLSLLKCSQFRPMLQYRFRGADGEKLVEIQSAQRLHLDLDGRARSMAMVQDRDIPGLPNVVLKDWVNPVVREARFEAIRNGKAGRWDNFHQRARAPKVDLPLDREEGVARACGECLHIHWRWGHAAFAFLVGGNKPIIDRTSTQDAYVHLIKPRAGEEGRPLEQLDSFEAWTPKNAQADGDVAFYWVADSTNPKDTFFKHWTWAIPRTSSTAGVTTQSLALGDPAAYFCPVLPV